MILGVSIFKTCAQTNEARFATSEAEVLGEEVVDIEFDEASKEGEEANLVVAPQEEKVDYYLPYPGILPDHPLYFLKMIRDRIWLILTTSPLKKAEVLLLFADKRIGASEVLVAGNKTSLGLTTATKAEKYLERAVGQEQKAEEAGAETQAFLEKLQKSCAKHEEILLEMGAGKLEDRKDMVENLLNYPRSCQQETSRRLSE